MFAFFRRKRKAANLPFVATARDPYDVIVRHQIECGPFNYVRTLSGQR